jgi:ubiquinone/menaquinone biosynthesis C-methylase UbiE
MTDMVGMTFLADGFQEADSDTTGVLVTCLDSISSHPFFRSVKEESFNLLRIGPGSAILEVGCGTGTDAWIMAGISGASGSVTGIDPGLSMIQRARDAKKILLPSTQAPRFLRMDGRYLGFPGQTFDAVREDRALQHISEPELVIREMFRVLKPGGRFSLFEPDWELFVIEGPGKGLTRTILNFWADTFMNGWIGRNLFALCRQNGARSPDVHPRTLVLHDLATCDQIFAIRETVARAVSSGIISIADADRWISYCEHADKEGRFFCSFTGFLVQGEK